MQTFLCWLLETTTKVVDRAGQPLIVWHGTHAVFDKFSKNYIGKTDDGYYGRGFYFSPSKEDAADYGTPRPYHLRISNPFVVPDHPSMGHKSLYDLRDRLAALKGVKVAKSNRTLPPGYHIEEEEKENDYFNSRFPESEHNPKKYKVYTVVPNRELYGTDQEIYGPDSASPEEAIMRFHDKMAGTEIRSGWAFGLLKDLIDRNQLVEILKANGYDGIFVQDAETGEVVEYVAFEPEQITPVQRN